MIALLLVLALAAPPHVRAPHRDRNQIAAFRRAWQKKYGEPCPAACATYVKRDGKFVPYLRCGACDVDHLCPLACGGPDDPSNMHWLDSHENRSKGSDCRACPPGGL